MSFQALCSPTEPLSWFHLKTTGLSQSPQDQSADFFLRQTKLIFNGKILSITTSEFQPLQLFLSAQILRKILGANSIIR